ncbi:MULTISPECIES: hypothetical protein [Pantoea]|uniref:Uncharacterized protein n=1 Tax=Candidatus Pantoea communis TaxID=2608354 RepID=A0ABX0RUM0_9GAMM|nr:hypothetical protein [Pantoea communis]NIG21291.1 hypothetical protein [Pantoea communis]
MNLNAENKANSFLFRLRSKDTPTGVSAVTLDKLMQETGLSKTELTHLALRNLANEYLPYYEPDDGPLTDAQIQRINEVSKAADIPEESFTEKLF